MRAKYGHSVTVYVVLCKKKGKNITEIRKYITIYVNQKYGVNILFENIIKQISLQWGAVNNRQVVIKSSLYFSTIKHDVMLMVFIFR